MSESRYGCSYTSSQSPVSSSVHPFETNLFQAVRPQLQQLSALRVHGNLLKLDFAPTVMLFRSLRWSSAPRTVHASAATSAADIDGSRMLGSCASVCEIETRERREDKEKRGEGSANWSCLDAAARLTRQCRRGGKTGREAVVVGSGRRTAVWPKTGYRQLAQLSSCPGRLQRQSCQRGGPPDLLGVCGAVERRLEWRRGGCAPPHRPQVARTVALSPRFAHRRNPSFRAQATQPCR